VVRFLPVVGQRSRSLFLCLGLLAVAVLMAMAMALAPARASAQGMDIRDCSELEDNCIRYCWIGDGVNMPCGAQGPAITATRTFNVSLNTATQSATGIAGDSGASGTANIRLEMGNNRICTTSSWSGIDSMVVGGHIHQGGYGQPENPSVWISLMPFDLLNGNGSGVSYCEILPAAEAYAIWKCPQQFHAVFHSKDHPAGAIRGQLGTRCEV
jgi:CHRD domain